MRRAATLLIFMALIALTVSGVFVASLILAKDGLTQGIKSGAPANTEPTPSAQSTLPTDAFGYFDFANEARDFRARVYLPESLGRWSVENPWRNATSSITQTPKVYVVAAFQATDVPQFRGFLRVAYDLQDADCGVLFSRLGQSNGLSLQKYTVDDINGTDGGKLYIFDFYGKQENVAATSKVICDKKSAMELLIIAPNIDKYAPAAAQMISTVDLHIPALPAKP
ncbi:hypothetical protein [Bradyrhizobium sp. Cp5.3]|uniref:hypothetical protein n=1 Tax=Bradyrhizobium sp. Cp5.3 TaxID=443598 RepID=UPI000488DBA4|nr:hypothetical protein [Bradyrhizobium sp. Cp5.3]